MDTTYEFLKTNTDEKGNDMYTTIYGVKITKDGVSSMFLEERELRAALEWLEMRKDPNYKPAFKILKSDNDRWEAL